MVEARFMFGKLPLRAEIREGSTAGVWDVAVFSEEGEHAALVASAAWDTEQMRVGPWNPETWNIGAHDYRHRGDHGDALHRLVQERLMDVVIAAHVTHYRKRFGMPHGVHVEPVPSAEKPRRGLLDRVRNVVRDLRPRGA
jgi:hypothetical protein